MPVSLCIDKVDVFGSGYHKEFGKRKGGKIRSLPFTYPEYPQSTALRYLVARTLIAYHEKRILSRPFSRYALMESCGLKKIGMGRRNSERGKKVVWI
jgi:hypothetical protein